MAGAFHRFRKPILWAFAAACVLGVGMQFLRPRLRNPPVTADLSAPADVKQILKTACYNCHSNETRLSWFDQPVPAYWLVVSDVRRARRHLNFSEIGKLSAAQRNGLLFEAVSQIELGAMPLPQYRLAHPESAISAAQLAVLKSYLTSLETNRTSTQAEQTVADEQYQRWIAGQPLNNQRSVALAPNGIAFIPDYKNWKAISSTDRADNRTMREILGNDIAVKAIAENRINPWPDGTEFAKAAWFQQPDDKGFVRTGAFFQVEFMIRDSAKYASTLGWGWARWRGDDLKPYGKDATFTRECVSCHRPMRNANYVFTAPIGGHP